MMASIALGAALLSGCRSTDYSSFEAYYEHEPKSIVVLPILNESTDAEAARFFLSTIARPLVYRGYYVLPIESTMEVLSREGLYDAGLAWDIEPDLLLEHFGADAALYVTIKAWDTTYVILSSQVTVTMHYRLVDCHTGATLWERQGSFTKKSGGYSGGGGGLAGLAVMLTAAAVDAAMTAALTDYVPLASQANFETLKFLPPGQYNEGYAELRKTITEWRAAQPKPEAK